MLARVCSDLSCRDWLVWMLRNHESNSNSTLGDVLPAQRSTSDITRFEATMPLIEEMSGIEALVHGL